jgi:hypothetical protein
MDYELRIIVEKVAISSQEVIERDTIQGSSWFPLHICGVKPTVSEALL